MRTLDVGGIILVLFIFFGLLALYRNTTVGGSPPPIQIKPEHCMFCGVIIESEFQVKEVER